MSLTFSQMRAQTIFKNHEILNNDTIVRSIIADTTSKSVVFFCPTAKVSKDLYLKKALELERKLKSIQFSDLTVHMVYYTQNTKNHSKGLKFISNDLRDTSIIGQFECYFIGFEENFLNRSKAKMKFNYDLIKLFEYENIYSVPIVDTNKCFDKIQDRIPFYADFISEAISPNYSNDEKMQFLRDSINILFGVISEMNEKLEKIEAEISNHKPKNQEKSKATESQAIQNNSDNRKKKN
jgi:hypothetical protein